MNSMFCFIRKCLRLELICLVLSGHVIRAQSPSLQGPPKSRRDSTKEVLHGVEITDPYRWLEDGKSPETRAWIDAENAFTRSVIGSLPGRDHLRQRVADLMKIDTVGMPVERSGRYFFAKRLRNQDLFVIYLRKGLHGKDEALIDPHPMSPDHSTSVRLLDVSKDGTLMAYGVQQGGEDELAIRLFDVEARKDLPDRLPKARYFNVSLKPDKTAFYYSVFEAQGPRVRFHALGTEPAQDVEIFGKEYGKDKIIIPEVSEDGRYLNITVFYGSSADKTEIYFQDLASHGPITPVVNDVSARFLPNFAGNQLLLETNWKAPKGRVLRADLSNPGRDHWREIIPEIDAVIDNVSVAGGRVFVNYLQNVNSRVKVFDALGHPLTDIQFPTLGTVSDIRGRWQGQEAFFEFSTFHIPPTIYRYDVGKGGQDVWARLNVPIDSGRFEVEQVWYESKDKTRVPMFLLHAKGLKRDGARPTLLTGYGGFNLSSTPEFSATAALWAERGGVYAVANLRGGGEFGEEWHKAGMLEHKQTVFDDFIAAAEWLIKNNYTNPSKLSIAGGSNGGLLVGAALTERPDLFQAVACLYPLLDMLRYQNFLVARFWVPEYGSSDDPEQFKYLYAYSPYHHVQPGTKYPAVILLSGDGDTRVDPLHARKMAALLQWATASDRPVLLRYDTTSGHSVSGLSVSKEIDERADMLSFLFWQLGVTL